MDILSIRLLGAALPCAAALLLAAASPLRAQEEESGGTCVPAATQADSGQAGGAGQADADGLVHWACTGAGYDAAARFTLAFPAGWEVTPPDGIQLVIEAQGEWAGIYVSAEDQLHAPRTRADSMGFWMRATRLYRGANPGLADVDAFQSSAGDPAGARRAVTLAQQADSALLAMALGRSVTRDGGQVLHQFAEVRTLVGHPAGFLEETYVTGDFRWRIATYVTVHDATVFVASFVAPEEEFNAAYPSWVQVYASLKIGTERDESAPRPEP